MNQNIYKLASSPTNGACKTYLKWMCALHRLAHLGDLLRSEALVQYRTQGSISMARILHISLALFRNITQNNRIQFITAKLGLSQLSPQTSFLEFHARIGANVHDGPVHPQQTTVL